MTTFMPLPGRLLALTLTESLRRQKVLRAQHTPNRSRMGWEKR